MKWKNEAMDRLRRYDSMRSALMNLPREISRLKEDAKRIRRICAEKTYVRGGEDRHEEELLNNIVCRQELEWSLKQVKQWLANTERGLLALSQEDRLILQRFYLYPEQGAMDRLCSELGVEQSSIYRRREQALERFTIAMYGFAET